MAATKLSWAEPKVSRLLETLARIQGELPKLRPLDPVQELVSCILSQNSTDAASVPAFERLVSLYPDWQQVVDLPQDELEEVIRSAGLAPQKSLAIQACLREIHRYQGGFDLSFIRELNDDEAFQWLCSLPGVGPKTASIVLCFAFGRDFVAVDTHVERVSQRLGMFYGAEKARTHKSASLPPAASHQRLRELCPKGKGREFHLRLLMHGRGLCKAPVPICSKCEIQEYCRWFNSKGPERQTAKVLKRREKQLERNRASRGKSTER